MDFDPIKGTLQYIICIYVCLTFQYMLLYQRLSVRSVLYLVSEEVFSLGERERVTDMWTTFLVSLE